MKLASLRSLLPKIIAGVVGLTGIVVIIGWIFDISVLKSILPQFVSMKFTTALSFVLSAATLYLYSKPSTTNQEPRELFLMFINFSLLLLMLSLVISVFIGIQTGIENLIVTEPIGTVNTVVPGRPAFSTMVLFILISLVGLASLLRLRSLHIATEIVGLILLLIGFVAVIGYIANIPALYFHIGTFSTAMALHAAILFVLLGVGFIMSGQDRLENNGETLV